MIKNKKLLYVALILFLVSISLNLPFPHKTLYDNTVILLNRPYNTLNGVNYVGITSLLFLLISLYFLVKSLNKYHALLVLIAIVVAGFFPPFLVSSFQKTFATGIYAISYESNGSHCNFNITNGTNLHGECELPLENYSSNEVQLTIEFYEPYKIKDNVPMVSLMNNNAPYKVILRGKESKRVKVETNMDVSKMKNQIKSGEVNGDVNIIIKSGGKSRHL